MKMVRGRRRVAAKKASTLGLDSLNGTKNKDCKLEFPGHLFHSSPSQAAITKYFTALPTPPTTDDSEPEVVSPQHKIQLVEPEVGASAATLSPSGALSQLTLSPSKKLLLSPRANGAVKSRRRLNPCQSQNQLSKTEQPPTPAVSQLSSTVTTKVSVKKTSVVETNHKLTEYFPVRRSGRRPKQTLLEEQNRTIEQAILSGCEDGLEVHHFSGKGRGVVTTRSFQRGEFVVEYSGELIDLSEAREREKRYAGDQNTGCYMYYFKFRNVQYCIDATPETERLGRLVNHSRQGNLQTRTVMVKNKPHLVLVARMDIAEGQEVLYDYGDRSKESLTHHPWLAL